MEVMNPRINVCKASMIDRWLGTKWLVKCVVALYGETRTTRYAYDKTILTYACKTDEEVLTAIELCKSKFISGRKPYVDDKVFIEYLNKEYDKRVDKNVSG